MPTDTSDTGSTCVGSVTERQWLLTTVKTFSSLKRHSWRKKCVLSLFKNWALRNLNYSFKVRVFNFFFFDRHAKIRHHICGLEFTNLLPQPAGIAVIPIFLSFHINTANEVLWRSIFFLLDFTQWAAFLLVLSKKMLTGHRKEQANKAFPRSCKEARIHSLEKGLLRNPGPNLSRQGLCKQISSCGNPFVCFLVWGENWPAKNQTAHREWENWVHCKVWLWFVASRSFYGMNKKVELFPFVTTCTGNLHLMVTKEKVHTVRHVCRSRMNKAIFVAAICGE